MSIVPTFDLAIDQDGDAIGRRAQCIEIVGDHEDREPQALLQLANQHIKFGGGYGIEPGGRFVQEKQLRIQRQGARQAGTLAHAPG